MRLRSSRWPGSALRAAAAFACIGAAFVYGGGAAAAEAGFGPRAVQDPYFGQPLFDFYQDRYFSALTELMASQQLGRMPHHVDEAEILRGGLFLSYGLHREAADIFQRLIDQGAPPGVRDRAWYYLAKIRYQRGLAAEAEQALDRVRGRLPGELEVDRALLKGNLLMRRGDYAAAAQVLEPLVDSDGASLYARYNLGVALVRSGSVARGSELLDEVGVVPGTTEEIRSLRDKANVALGFAALRDKDAERAKVYLERVRLTGLMANKALLGYGWAAEAMNDPKSALVSWLELSGRDGGDAAVLESRLAVPYALAQIGSEGQALQQYGAAIHAYDDESASLDESIADIRGGKLLEGLVASNPGEEMGWFWNIDRLPPMRHAAHLVGVLALHDFQEGFKNYRDLLFLARNLRLWESKMDTFGDMLVNRRQAYAVRLAQLGMQARDAGLARLEARQAALETELQAEAQGGDGAAFADAHERALAARIERARAALRRLEVAGAAGIDGAPGEGARREAADRLRRVDGALGWQLGQELPSRLWDTRKQMRQIAVELAQAHDRQQRLARAQQEEPQRFDGFAQRIQALQERIQALKPRVAQLIVQQRQAVEELAVAELQQQKEDLVAYGNQARFAVAQIFDRANRAAAAPGAARPGEAPPAAPADAPDGQPAAVPNAAPNSLPDAVPKAAPDGAPSAAPADRRSDPQGAEPPAAEPADDHVKR